MIIGQRIGWIIGGVIYFKSDFHCVLSVIMYLYVLMMVRPFLLMQRIKKKKNPKPEMLSQTQNWAAVVVVVVVGAALV